MVRTASLWAGSRPSTSSASFSAPTPGDLPIEQIDKLHFVVNLKAAKALGLTIPQSVLVCADEVIQ